MKTKPKTKKPIPRAFSFPRWLALVLALAVTLIGGGLYGNFSQRWGVPPDLAAAGAHLSEMPRQVGNWSLVEDLPLGQSVLDMLQCAGHVSRRYVDQASGRSIQVALLAGPPGPIAVHTPEVCFSSRNYDRQGERVIEPIESDENREDTYWRLDFHTKNPLADSLRVYYAWSTGDAWEASQSPRFAYGGAPMLFKIQLATPIPRQMEEGASDAGREFLDALAQSGWSLLPP